LKARVTEGARAAPLSNEVDELLVDDEEDRRVRIGGGGSGLEVMWCFWPKK
jgi:hypothetical protein